MAEKMKIAPAKMPNNIVTLYGNSSSATIPLNMAQNCGEQLQRGSLRVCVSGFGVGLTWIQWLWTWDRWRSARLWITKPT